MTIKEKVKKLWVEHKGKIIVGVSAVGLGIAAVVLTRNGKETKPVEIDRVGASEFVQGKEILMNFVDPETNEILWRERCTESYMNDFKDCGMQYEEVRQLNGIEEEA